MAEIASDSCNKDEVLIYYPYGEIFFTYYVDGRVCDKHDKLVFYWRVGLGDTLEFRHAGRENDWGLITNDFLTKALNKALAERIMLGDP